MCNYVSVVSTQEEFEDEYDPLLVAENLTHYEGLTIFNL